MGVGREWKWSEALPGGYLFPCSPEKKMALFPCSPKTKSWFSMFPCSPKPLGRPQICFALSSFILKLALTNIVSGVHVPPSPSHLPHRHLTSIPTCPNQNPHMSQPASPHPNQHPHVQTSIPTCPNQRFSATKWLNVIAWATMGYKEPNMDHQVNPHLVILVKNSFFSRIKCY